MKNISVYSRIYPHFSLRGRTSSAALGGKVSGRCGHYVACSVLERILALWARLVAFAYVDIFNLRCRNLFTSVSLTHSDEMVQFYGFTFYVW